MIGNEPITTNTSDPEPAVRVVPFIQKGIKIHQNNPIEQTVSDIIDYAQLIQEYGVDNRDDIIKLHQAAKQLLSEVNQYLIP
jgi:hypothetical protein